MNRDDLIKKLRNDPLYKKALGMVGSKAERQQIIAFTEGFITKIADAAGIVSSHNVTDKIKVELSGSMSGSV